MLFNRPPRIEHRSPNPSKGQEHLRPSWIAILRWLQAHKVEYVLIGAVAEAARGNTHVDGPIAVVPAPYRRNLERLARALTREHARLRVDAGGVSGQGVESNSAWTGGLDRRASIVPSAARTLTLRLRAAVFVTVMGFSYPETTPPDRFRYQSRAFRARLRGLMHPACLDDGSRCGRSRVPERDRTPQCGGENGLRSQVRGSRRSPARRN